MTLIVVFSAGLLIAGVLSYKLLQNNARDEVIQQAGIMMDAALAIRSYTVKEIRPLLAGGMKKKFLPQSVPSYAATQNFNALREANPDYIYKEATLNPTNPRDRATDWETDLVQQFRNHPDQMELIGARETPSGTSIYLARPIQIKNAGCLVCHSTSAVAPKTMISLYGPSNGFGWNLNEVVGAQIVSVPTSLPDKKAEEAFLLFMSSLVGIFVVIFILLNVMMHKIIIKPITTISTLSDQISTGNFDIPEFSEEGKDEVAMLAASFNRMRRSVTKALEMLEK